MPALAHRSWVPEDCEILVQSIADDTAKATSASIDERIELLIKVNTTIHDVDCINLNPATNVLNPKAEAVLGRGLGSRASLGYPGNKYEMGLEAIEQIEVIAAELAAEIFLARHAEIRVASGAMANLYAFMALAKPGDAIIAPPATIGGHVTHQQAGCAGLYGLHSHAAPISADGFTVDLAGLAALARRILPKVISIGGSLNLFEHPVAQIRAIADTVGAKVLFDAAHQCGLIAGRVWKNPLQQGAHIMTMSTYKSLGGPAGGLVLTNEPDLAQRLDAIAFPGMTANFDAAKSAALAIALLDWREYGAAYATSMVETAQSLASALISEGVPVFRLQGTATTSHQFAIEAARYGGGQAASRQLRNANILACGIGLPLAAVEGDLNGLRLGTPEIVRRGMQAGDMPVLARFIARALQASNPQAIAIDVTKFRKSFNGFSFMR